MHLLENGYDIRIIRELLRHQDVRTTKIDKHLSNKVPGIQKSPGGRPRLTSG